VQTLSTKIVEHFYITVHVLDATFLGISHIFYDFLQFSRMWDKPTTDISCDQLVRNNNKIEIQFFCQVVIASAKRREKHK
jgi:hypothetical protein